MCVCACVSVCVFVQLGQQTGRGDYGKASVAVISQFSGLRERRTEKGLTEITAVTSHHTHIHTLIPSHYTSLIHTQGSRGQVEISRLILISIDSI